MVADAIGSAAISYTAQRITPERTVADPILSAASSTSAISPPLPADSIGSAGGGEAIDVSPSIKPAPERACMPMP
eukprot:12906961-Prorocentrum_lima.AAC.1